MGINKRTFSEEEVAKRLSDLRKRVEDNETLVKSGIDINDTFLLAFLKGRKFSIEDAYDTVEKFVDVRIRKYAEFFSDVKPLSLLYMCEQPKFMGLLKYKDPATGARITVTRMPNLNKLNKIEDLITSGIMMLEESLYLEDATNNGVICIASGEGVGLRHFREITPQRIKMSVDLTLNSFPYRLKKLHVIHCSTIVSWMIGIAKPFLTKKLRDRIVIHKTPESLRDYFPQEVLPSWLGGSHTEEDDHVVYDADFEHIAANNHEYYENLSRKIKENKYS